MKEGADLMLEKLKKLPITTRNAIYYIAMFGGCIIGLISGQFSRDGSVNAGMVIGLILIVGAVVWHFLLLRCPHCGHHFHVRQAIPKHCPDCGGKIL